MSTIINTVTFGVFVERIKKFCENNWPDNKLDVTNNEVLLYVYEAIGTAIVKASELNYQMEGLFSTPEGFITTYKFAASTFTQDINTGIYEIQLPTPPINLPLGYSISAPFFGGNNAKSFPLIAVNGFQVGYFDKIPTPNYGVYYWPEGTTFKMQSPDFNLITSGLTLYVRMLSPVSATGNDGDTMNVPEDQKAVVFDIVVNKLVARMNRPKDLATDSEGTHTFNP